MVHIQHYKRQLSLFEGDYFGYFPGTGEIPDSLQVIGMAINYSFPKICSLIDLRFGYLVELYLICQFKQKLDCSEIHSCDPYLYHMFLFCFVSENSRNISLISQNILSEKTFLK